MRSRPRAAAALVATALGALFASPACARPGVPRGGIPDRRPPVVISAEPAAKALVADAGARIRLQFNERISERPARGTMDDAVLVSPATGVVRVRHGKDFLDVRVEGGLRAGTVYRVTLLPVISDLFNNTMREPFELVFSTGGRMIENAVAGQALDRITGRPLPDLTVELLPRAPQPDTVIYVARSDDRGLYFFRYVQPGVYNLVAFQDRDRDRLPGRRETSGTRALLVEERPDTLLVDVAVLEPDTTAAAVVRAEAVDSVTLRLVLSDYLDPAAVAQAHVEVTPPEGRAPVPVTAVLHPEVYDSLRRDTTRAPGPAPRGSTGVALATPGQERGGLPVGLPLPRQELIVRLGEPLELDVTYRVAATGLVNVNGIPNGRGDTTFVRKAAPARPVPPGSGPPPGAAGAPAPATVPGAAPPVAAPPSVPDSAAARRDSVQIALRRSR